MKILSVEKGSIAEEVGLQQGDEIISIDDRQCTDVLDYEFCLSQDFVKLEVLRDGQTTIFEIEKGEYEDLGLSFEEFKIRQCRNNCIFCFVNQLPDKEDIRPSLRIKDDDYRMSFISGTYITLTNINENDINRILRLRLSPIYVSVHTVDEKLRKYMLGVNRCEPVLEIMKRLYDGGIQLHAQIVYCPEINEDYEQTFKALSPIVESLAIVPVGLTKNCNPCLRPVSADEAERVIASVKKYQKINLRTCGVRKIFASDEFYIKANMAFPRYEEYEEFPQIENGVGLVASFIHDFDEAFEVATGQAKNVSIATGMSAYKIIKDAADKINKKFNGNIRVYAIANEFFGHSVTVTGLTVGRDILQQLKDKDLGEELIIVRTMLKEFGDCFLDNMTLKELGEKLNITVRAVEPTGDAFVRSLVKEDV